MAKRKTEFYDDSKSSDLNDMELDAETLEILNNDRLENLIRLRNESPVGHGFKGISKEEIESIYGSPMEVMRDLVKACELLDLGISSNKYDNINEMVIHMIGSQENH